MRLLIIASLLCLQCLMVNAQQSRATVILVRHAEKGFDESGDPDLTDEGKSRALELARVLKDQPIDAIYTTPFKRTRQTMEPLAQQKNIQVEEYNPFKLDEVLKVIEASTGRVIVFSGHSNTIPIMLNQMLGEERFAQLDEEAYDNLFIATFESIGNTEVVQLKFGIPSEETSPE